MKERKEQKLNGRMNGNEIKMNLNDWMGTSLDI